jgi:dTDP-glucose 4,6-dehydratase
MNRKLKNVIVTGGAGFIGSHVVKAINRIMPDCNVFIIDCLTYAGNMDNVAGTWSNFIRMDIRNAETISKLLEHYPQIDAIIHLAAESHVDRSIESPLEFVETNVMGTVNLLNLSLEYKKLNPDFIFYHVSTDEVFGSLEMEDPKFNERTPYDPKSPYSASKAASDHFVRAYAHTYGLNVLLSNCSNNYGPNQYNEKLIPVVIDKLKRKESIPVYGNGMNVRDWLYVEDHADAIIHILKNGKFGETYCVGGDCELSNLDVVGMLIRIYDEIQTAKTGVESDSMNLLTFVKDRAGHDFRYAIDHTKITRELGWTPKMTIKQGLIQTVSWYMNQD